MGKFEKKPTDAPVTAQKRPTQAQKASRKKKNNNKLPLLLGIGGAVLIIIACIVGFFIIRGNKEDVQDLPAAPVENYITENAYVAGVHIGGMTREQAIEALRAEFTPVDTTGMDEESAAKLANTVSFGEKLQDMNIELYTAAPDFALFTTTFDPTMVEDVNGNLIPNAQNPVAEPEQPALEQPADAPKQENGEPYTMESTLCVPASDVTITFDLEAVVEEAYQYGRSSEVVAGDRVDVDISKHLQIEDGGTIDEVLASLSDKLEEGSDTVTERSTTFIDDEDGNPVEVECVKITFGTVGRKIEADSVRDHLLQAYMKMQFKVQYIYEETFPEVLDLDQLFADYDCVAPVNAKYDPQTYQISASKPGWGFLMKDAYAQVVKAEGGDTVILPLVELAPERTEQMVAEILDEQMFPDILATYDSPHVYNPVRTHNLELACAAINGTVLQPGDVFSFNNIVGERTAAKGYGEAAVYVGGRTEDQLGGGVCQVASTIYWCTLKADLEVVERAPHRYTPTYIPWGMDATIYWKSLDYKFRNNTAYPIRIEASVSGGYVHITLVGTETKDYTVKLFYEVESSQKSGTKTIYIHPDMANYSQYAGYKHGETIQTAYDGYTVYTYMQKLDAAGNVISTTRVNISTYKSRDKEVAYLLDPSIPMSEQIDENGNVVKPTESTEPSTEPTEPTEPTESTEPTEPTTEPTEPTTEPTEPTTEPTEPPTESTEPTELPELPDN